MRATPLVFKRERFPVLRCVLIRALRRCEYVYKMLTTVSLSVTSDPVTSRSSGDTVPVSSFRLHVESGPDPVTLQTAQPKAACQPKSASQSMSIVFLFDCNFVLTLMCVSVGYSNGRFTTEGILHRIYICIYFWNTSQDIVIRYYICIYSFCTVGCLDFKTTVKMESGSRHS